MYKNNEFEYALWKDKEGRCFARIKGSKSFCEISMETMKFLRREEKRLQREKELKKILATTSADEDVPSDERIRAAVLYPLSLSDNNGEDGNRESSWLESYENVEDRLLQREFIQKLFEVLSPQQQRVFNAIILEGHTYKDYSEKSGISGSRISIIMKKIRKKAKKIMEGG